MALFSSCTAASAAYALFSTEVHKLRRCHSHNRISSVPCPIQTHVVIRGLPSFLIKRRGSNLQKQGAVLHPKRHAIWNRVYILLHTAYRTGWSLAGALVGVTRARQGGNVHARGTLRKSRVPVIAQSSINHRSIIPQSSLWLGINLAPCHLGAVLHFHRLVK